MPADMCCGGRLRFLMWTVLGKTKNMCKYLSGCGHTVRQSWNVLGAWIGRTLEIK